MIKMMIKKSIVCVVVLFACVSCSHSGMVESSTPSSFSSGTELILKGEDDKAERQFKSFLRIYPNHLYVGDAYYHMGRINYKRGLFSQARSDFKKASEQARREETFVLSQLYLGKSYLDDPRNPKELVKRSEEALIVFENLVDDHRHLITVPEVLFSMGKCYVQLSDISAAHKVYREIKSRYPGTPWAKKITQRGLDVYKEYSVQVGVFKSHSGAHAIMRELKEKGFESYAVRKDVYSIRVGHFKTYIQSKEMAAKLKASNYSAIMKP